MLWLSVAIVLIGQDGEICLDLGAQICEQSNPAQAVSDSEFNPQGIHDVSEVSKPSNPVSNREG